MTRSKLNYRSLNEFFSSIFKWIEAIDVLNEKAILNFLLFSLPLLHFCLLLF